MALTIALCDACPSSEVDEMTISLLNIFDSRGLGFILLEALIDHEVEETGECLDEIMDDADSDKKMKPSFSGGTAWQPRCYRFTRNGKEQRISKQPYRKF